MSKQGHFENVGGMGRIQETPTPIRKGRQKLVVRTKKGEVFYGITFGLNRKMPDFTFELWKKTGEPLNRTLRINFEEIKAIFYVKSFDGRFDESAFTEFYFPDTRPIIVKFFDGEAITGYTTHAHWMDEPRFFLIPEEQGGNNLMVLVERSAVESIQDAHTYAKKQREAFAEYKKQHASTGHSEQEIWGDFHFRNHEYGDASRCYRQIMAIDPDNTRVRKKLCAAKYNLGIRQIKRHDYAQALRFMELVLELDPHHPQALEKATQLRAHIAKHKRP